MFKSRNGNILFVIVILVLIFSFSVIISFADGEVELPEINSVSATNNLTKLYFSNDSKMLLTAGREVMLSNLANGTDKTIKKGYQSFKDASFSPDGNYFAFSIIDGVGDSSILLCDTKTGEIKKTFSFRDKDSVNIDYYYNNSLFFSQNNKFLIIGLSTNIYTGLLKYVDIESGNDVKSFNLPSAPTLLKFSTTKNVFAVALANNSLQIRDFETGNISKTISNIFTAYNGGFFDMAYSIDGKYFAVSFNSNSSEQTQLYDVDSNYQLIATENLSGKVLFTKDNKYLIVGNKVFPMEDKLKSNFTINVKDSDEVINPQSVVLSNDNTCLAYISNSKDYMVNILDPSGINKRLISVEISPTSISLSPDKSQKLSLMGIYSDGTKESLDSSKTDWQVADLFVAKVDNSVIKGVSNGNTTLTAVYKNVKASLPVMVKESPRNLSGSYKKGSIVLKWSPLNDSTNLIGYNLYKSTQTGDFNKSPITDFPLTETEYTDNDVDGIQNYSYICKAVFKDKTESEPSNVLVVSPKNKTIILQVDNPKITIDGEERDLEAGTPTMPIIYNGRTVLPIRALIEELGGTVEWNNEGKKVTLKLNSNIVEMCINNKKAIVNGVEKTLDVPPVILSGRTMIPLRFVGENLGCSLDWEPTTKTITITQLNVAKSNDGNITNPNTENVKTSSGTDKYIKHTDTKVGYIINYPKIWGAPKTRMSDETKTEYTDFYNTDNISITFYSKTHLADFQSREDFIKGLLLEDDKTVLRIPNSSLSFRTYSQSDSGELIRVVAIKENIACIMELNVKNSTPVDEKSKIVKEFANMTETFELLPGVG